MNNTGDECRFVAVGVHRSRQTGQAGPSGRENDLSIDEVFFFRFRSPLCIFFASILCEMHSSCIVSIIIMIDLDRSIHKNFGHISCILCRCMNSTRLVVVSL